MAGKENLKARDATSGGVIVVDLACVGCGYNLRHVPVDAASMEGAFWGLRLIPFWFLLVEREVGLVPEYPRWRVGLTP